MAFKANQSSKQAAQQRNGKPLHPAMSTGVSAGRRGLEPQLQSMGYEDGASALSPANNALSPRNVQAYGGKTNEADVQNAAAGGVRGASAPLPYLDTIQSAFGKHDVSGVQCAVGGAAQTACESMGAEAYATGNTVAFKGATSLHTAAHEAAHIVQQRGGVSLKGGVGQAGDPYEQHADAVADLVVQGKSAESVLDPYAGGGSAGGGVQSKAVQRRAAAGGGRTLNPNGKYTVVSGDTLSAIALDFLGDAMAYPQIQAANSSIISNPNVIDVGWELTVPTAGGPTPAPSPGHGSYQAALDEHARNVAYLDRLITRGVHDPAGATTFGVAWPNACEWLKAGETALHVLTTTHDSAARAAALGKRNHVARFGIQHPVPVTSTYNETDLADSSNVECSKKGVQGFRKSGTPSTVAIMDPIKRGPFALRSTIVHEIQHDSDHHSNDAWSRYVTEFNSYWIDCNLATFDDQPGTAIEGLPTRDGTPLNSFDNRRQQKIFRHLYNSDSSYPYVKRNWHNPDFQSKVLSLTYAQGHNLVNSLRIEQMWQAIEGFGTDEEAFNNAARSLRPAERVAIQSEGMRSVWIDKIDGDFSGVERIVILTELGLL
jgi:nucleoid-associated protein YgaU